MADRRKARRVILAVGCTVALAVALSVVVARSVFEHQLDQERVRTLDGVRPGAPFQQVDAALRQRGRLATDEEAREFAFPDRPPNGRYVHYSSGVLMIRIDEKDGVVGSVEAEKVEFI
jgi:hypothetical protein